MKGKMDRSERKKVKYRVGANAKSRVKKLY